MAITCIRIIYAWKKNHSQIIFYENQNNRRFSQNGQTIINQKFSNFETFVNSKEQKGNPYYLLLTENMDIPNNINFSNILSIKGNEANILLRREKNE